MEPTYTFTPPDENLLNTVPPGEERNALRQILWAIAPQGRQDVTFVDADTGAVYGTSPRSSMAGVLAVKSHGIAPQSTTDAAAVDGSYVTADGETVPLPPADEAPPQNFLSAQDARSDVVDCYNSSSQGSGPAYRISYIGKHPINWMHARVKLPSYKGMWNVPDQENLARYNFNLGALPGLPVNRLMVTSSPFVYGGGWSNNGTAPADATDAGLQASTGNYSNAKGYETSNGKWALFLRDEDKVYTDLLTGKTADTQATYPGYRFAANSTVDMFFFTWNNVLVVGATDDIAGAESQQANPGQNTKPIYRYILLFAKNGSKWRGNGQGTILKFMHTFGQASRLNPSAPSVNGQLLRAAGVMKGSQIQKLEVGFIDGFQNNSDGVRGGTYFTSNIAFIRPVPGRRKDWLGDFDTSCSSPNRTNVVSDHMPSAYLNFKSVYPETVSISGKSYVGSTVSIDLRAPTGIQLGEDKRPAAQPGWSPASGSEPSPAAIEDKTITMVAKTGQKASKVLYFQNYGNQNSLALLSVYPLNASPYGTLLGHRLRMPKLPPAQTDQKGLPWPTALFKPNRDLTDIWLKRPDSPITPAGGNSTKLLTEAVDDVSATCPSGLTETKTYEADQWVVYSSGLVDAFDPATPSKDDASGYIPHQLPGLLATKIHLKLTCKGNPPLPPPPPPGPKACTGSCGYGYSSGDPHLTTFDGLNYDFQGVGEFVLARSQDRKFEVQARYLRASDYASSNSAIAMNVNGDHVGIYPVTNGLGLLDLNGTLTPVSYNDQRTISLPQGGFVNLNGFGGGLWTTVIWPGGSRVEIIKHADFIGFVQLYVAPGLKGQLEGLLGNFDDNPNNDLTDRAGTVYPITPTFDQLYKQYGESWRVTQAESLFHYDPGRTSASYTNRVLPIGFPPPASPAATAQCQQAGVQDPRTIQNCAADLTLTGDSNYVTDAVQSDPNTVRVNLVPSARDLATGDSLNLQAYLDGKANIADLRWTASAGTVTPGANGAATFLAPSTPGDVTLSAAVGSVSTQVTVHVHAPGVYLTFAPSQLFVSGTFPLLTAVYGNYPDQTLVWDAGGGTVTTQPDGTVLYTAPSTPGTYTLTASLAADRTIKTSTTVTVISPVISLFPSNPTVVLGNGVGLVANVAGYPGAYTLDWQASGGQLSPSDAGAYFTASQPGQYTVRATIHGRPDLTAQATVQVVLSALSVTPSSGTVDPGASVVLTAAYSDTGVSPSYTWQASTGTLSATSGQSVHYTAPLTPGTYSVTLGTNTGSPPVTSTITVVEPQLRIFGPWQGGAPVAFIGQTFELTGNGAVDPSNLTWSADGASLVPATVALSANASTMFTAVTAGTNTVTLALKSDPSRAVQLHINVKPAALTVTPSAIGVIAGGALTFQLPDLPPYLCAGPSSVVWTASAGTLTSSSGCQVAWTAPSSPATATISASLRASPGVHGAVDIPVLANSAGPITIQGATGQTAGQLHPGQSLTLTALNSSGQPYPSVVNWSSSCGTLSTSSGPSSTLTLSSAVLTNGTGTCTVTATQADAQSFTGTFPVTALDIPQFQFIGLAGASTFNMNPGQAAPFRLMGQYLGQPYTGPVVFDAPAGSVTTNSDGTYSYIAGATVGSQAFTVHPADATTVGNSYTVSVNAPAVLVGLVGPYGAIYNPSSSVLPSTIGASRTWSALINSDVPLSPPATFTWQASKFSIQSSGQQSQSAQLVPQQLGDQTLTVSIPGAPQYTATFHFNITAPAWNFVNCVCQETTVGVNGTVDLSLTFSDAPLAHPTNRLVLLSPPPTVWSATGGSVAVYPANSWVFIYTAPSIPGDYTITEQVQGYPETQVSHVIHVQ